MKKFLLVTVLSVFAAAPAFAVFTDNFEANPFGISGDWHRSGDVIWTGNHTGNDYVKLGRLLNNDYSRLWRSFTAPTTAEYCIGFDYQFIGCDIIPRKDDKVLVQIGICRTPLFDIFEATSSADLTSGLFDAGDWQTVKTPPPVITLQGGETYWLLFRFQEATGCITPLTKLLLDNVSVDVCRPVVPAPGAVLLGGIGVSLVGWLRTRKMI